jgi:hypothetical protein
MARSVAIQIGELSRQTGCHIETIRYYERSRRPSQIMRVRPAGSSAAAQRPTSSASSRRAASSGVSLPEAVAGVPVC